MRASRVEVGREALQEACEGGGVVRLDRVGEREHPAGLQHAPEFAGDTRTHDRRQFVKQEDARHRVERGVGERQTLGQGLHHAGAAARPRLLQIRRRKVEPRHMGAWEGGAQVDEEGARTAADVDDTALPRVFVAPGARQ